MPGYVTAVLPYLPGGAMVLAGMVRGTSYIQNKEFLGRNSYELAHGLFFLFGSFEKFSTYVAILGLELS